MVSFVGLFQLLGFLFLALIPLVLLMKRASIKWVRGWGHKFLELLLFVFAGLAVGMLPWIQTMTVMYLQAISYMHPICLHS